MKPKRDNKATVTVYLVIKTGVCNNRPEFRAENRIVELPSTEQLILNENKSRKKLRESIMLDKI